MIADDIMQCKLPSGQSAATRGKAENILTLLQGDPRMTVAGLADKTGISEATVNRRLRELSQLGIIERSGSNRAGYWVVREYLS